MSTAGQDFFDENFFNTQIVALVDYPLEKLKYYGTIGDDAIAEWGSQNQITDSDKDIARKMLSSWTSEVLSLPFAGEHKIKHYFEKVLWLIQSYCERGWTNPLKGINHLDNGQIVVHPGTNRCVAAKFLKCSALKILINIHKEQSLLKSLSNYTAIDNERDLRNALHSPNKILWRTESREELWIAGQRQIGRDYPDFTYEFLGADAWPEFEKFNLWIDIIGKMLPLNIWSDHQIDIRSNLSGKFFRSNNKMFEYAVSKSVDKTLPYIYIDRSLKDFDIFELLFFVSVNHRYSRTLDDSIIIHNPYALTNRELIIPDHYVNF
jgi:hypothetical protein